MKLCVCIWLGFWNDFLILSNFEMMLFLLVKWCFKKFFFQIKTPKSHFRLVYFRMFNSHSLRYEKIKNFICINFFSIQMFKKNSYFEHCNTVANECVTIYIMFVCVYYTHGGYLINTLLINSFIGVCYVAYTHKVYTLYELILFVE